MIENDIKNLIVTVRGKQVLLDSDVARLYGYETRCINEAANRNKKRFPEHFRFQLTREEAADLLKSQFATLNVGAGGVAVVGSENLKSQFATSSFQAPIRKYIDKEESESNLESQITTLGLPDGINYGGRRKLPYAYTEQGIAMLSGLLRNDTAIQVSISIIEAFVEMRQFLNANSKIYENIAGINSTLFEHDRRLLEQDTKINQALDLLNAPGVNKQWVFFKGQFYDAYQLVIDIIKGAKTSIVLIDNYFDDSIFELLAKKRAGVAVILVTGRPDKLSTQSQKKFSKQYGAVSVVECKDFHDRFMVLDNSEVYAFGASFKDLGNKCFEVSKNEDTERFISYVDAILN